MLQTTAKLRARVDESQEAGQHNAAYEPSSKRAKRGKYVGNACAQCKRRKIRCSGGTPCAQCVAKRRDCASGRDQPEASDRGREDSTSASTTITTSQRPIQGIDTHELLSRLMSVESQLNSVLSKEKTGAADMYKTPDHSTDTVIIDGGSPERQHRSIEQRHNFVGEPATLHALRQTEALLDDVSLRSQRRSPESSSLTPKPYSTLNASAERKSRVWLRTILLSFGIVPDKQQWLKYLRDYFGELHTLFPFLHPPTIRDTHEFLWQSSLLVSSNDLSNDSKESKFSVAILFLCLANGRCVGSNRVDNVDGKHSAGWSLYCVALYLLQEDLDIMEDHPSSLHSTQAQALMVIYLFALDANEKAYKKLAQAVSSAHILGLNRQNTYQNMPLFEKEMFRRLWWCIYVLDRRISFETGRPILIQDVNTNTDWPTNVSDERLQDQKLSLATQDESTVERESETAQAVLSEIPYFNAFITYSRLVGEVWNFVHCEEPIPYSGRNIVDVYMEPLMEESRKTMPQSLCYQPSKSFEEQFSGMPWWQIKQSILMYLRYTSLKLKIRRAPSAFVDGKNTDSRGTLKNDSVCCELALSVVALFDSIPNQYPKIQFAFMHYLTSATMIMFGITTKNPVLKPMYHQCIVSAVRTLMTFCRKTWVSGKMIRTISTLDQMIRSTLGPISDMPLPSRASEKSSRPANDLETRLRWTEDHQILPRPPQAPNVASPATSLSPGRSLPVFPPHQQHPSAAPIGNQAYDHASTLYTKSNPEPFQWNGALVSPAHTETTPSGQQPRISCQPQSQEYQQQETQPEPKPANDLSYFGSTDDQIGTFSDLPSWAMANFDFEQAIISNTSDTRAISEFWDLLDREPSTLQSWSH